MLMRKDLLMLVEVGTNLAPESRSALRMARAEPDAAVAKWRVWRKKVAPGPKGIWCMPGRYIVVVVWQRSEWTDRAFNVVFQLFETGGHTHPSWSLSIPKKKIRKKFSLW